MNSIRVRRVAATVLTVIAAAASIGTSPIDYDLRDGVGGRVVLGPDNPEIRIPFTVSATDAALDLGDPSVTVSYEVVWIDADQATRDSGPVIYMESPAGEIRGIDTPLGCWADCLGSSVLIMQWPSEATSGELAVTWAVTADFGVLDSEPPDDAMVTVEATPSSSVPAPLLSRHDITGTSGLTVVDITVSSDAAITDLAVHHPGPVDRPSSLRIGQGSLWTDVPVQGALSIALPEVCASGPCVFDLQAVVQRSDNGRNSSADYELVAAPGEDAHITAFANEHDPWVVSASSEPITVSLDEGKQSTKIPLALSLPVSLDGVPIAATVSIDVIEASPDHQLSFSLETNGETFERYPARFHPTHEFRTMDFWLPVECGDTRCSANADLDVRYWRLEEGPLNPVELQLIVTANFSIARKIEDTGIPVLQIGDQR